MHEYGLPSRVRGDDGGENNGIEEFMWWAQSNRNAYIRGPSVRNQRAERMHYDVTHCALAHFINLFTFMERQEILNVESDLDMHCLHFVYLHRVNDAIASFRDGWNNHPVSTEGNQTPLQMWTTDMLNVENRYRKGITDYLEGRHKKLGTFPYTPTRPIDLSTTVEVNDSRINSDHAHIALDLSEAIDAKAEDNNYGIDVYLHAKEFLESRL